MKKFISFQDIIIKLQNFWAEYGCSILQPYDVEMGAGTFHPATVLRTLSKNPWNVAFVQPSRRPTDSRFGRHPNRVQHYYQFQVILKPSPDNMQQLYLDSLKQLGIGSNDHDIRFVEDDWKSPTLGAAGLGWEVWCDGMEISQFTYMQQIGGIDIRPVPGEITYGLERIALYLQNVKSINDIVWNKTKDNEKITYGDIEFGVEIQFSKFNVQCVDTQMLLNHFSDYEKECLRLIENNLPLPAYDFCIKTSHIFNVLDARGVISVAERVAIIKKIRNLTKSCCVKWLEMQKTEKIDV